MVFPPYLAFPKLEKENSKIILDSLTFTFPLSVENLSNWERYESNRDGLNSKLEDAVAEFKATRRIYDLASNAADLASRTETAKNMRKDVEDTFKTLSDSNAILAKIAPKIKAKELEDEVL